ncbi:AAA family ATPase [Lacinutrix venerupis]|uniref:ATPase AAA-type core domain-containing protein n=1 Tax=Lacinutrix venerupis TaxID=1486034 RepID=A0AAC9PVK2_9FLAO|nr:AAA family ATPase [Lacinutrix venerupis]APX99721.1 hypothetical protein BWR22_05155 [Lacinutrix venerupis]
MKICFIWIDRYRNFKDFGFNLSSSIKFKFDQKDNLLIKKDIDDLPNDFFGNQIVDVVGVIGKNGSGKSNAIELICNALKNPKTTIQSDFLIITESNNSYTCHYSFNNRNKPKAKFKIELKDYDGSINPLKVVFFSNVFDERRNDFGSDITDISVNNLYNRNMLFRRNKVTDFEKQVRLINSKIFSSLNIDIPEKIQFTSKVWRNRFNSSMERNLYREGYSNIKDFQKFYRDRLREIKPENKFIHLLRFGYFFEIIYQISRQSRTNYNLYDKLLKDINDFISEMFKLRTEEISENLILFLERNLIKSYDGQFSLFSDIKSERTKTSTIKNLESQLHFLKTIKRDLDFLNLEYSVEGSGSRALEYFTFDYNSIKAKNFINEFISLFATINIFDVNWLGISSGHKAYINLFASLFQELKFSRTYNLLLCIDEGDLYLHPKWQIEFFDKLLNVLPNIYSGNIQLILSSHSPFLLSDLPNQNITILDKNFENSSIDGIDLPINTFGGNLYDLYAEPFFLDNKRTSDFAYKKTKEIISIVESGGLNKKKSSELLKVIELIGDDIIKYRLKNQLSE